MSSFYGADVKKLLGSPLPLDVRTGKLDITPMNAVCKSGAFAVLKWLWKRHLLHIDTSFLYNAAGNVAKRGHLAIVKWLYDSGVANGAEESLAHLTAECAAHSGNLAIIQWLDARGLLVEKEEDETSCWKDIALAAAKSGSVEILRWIHAKNMLCSLKWEDRATPLTHYVATQGNLESLKFLHSIGLFDVQKRDYLSGLTVAHMAAVQNRVEMLEWMWCEGLMADVKSSRTKRSYDWGGDKDMVELAAYSGSLKVLKWLQSHGVIESQDGAIISHRALEGHLRFEYGLEILMWLKEEGMLDLKAKNEEGRTISHVAAVAPLSPSLLEWLYSNGVLDCQEVDAKGKNVSHVASSSVGKLQWLHERGLLDLENVDFDGRNVAHLALSYGCLDVLQWLHSVGLLDATKTDKLGMCLGHIAATQFFDANALASIRWLYSEGMLTSNVADGDGNTMAHHAAAKRHLEVLKFLHKISLFDATAQNNGGMNIAMVAAGFPGGFGVKCLQWMHSIGELQAQARTATGRTVAHFAAQYGALDVLKWMHSLQGFDPEAKDDGGWKIAHEAAEAGRLDILTWMHEQDMLNPSDANNDGQTVAQLAVGHDWEVPDWLSPQCGESMP